MMRKSGLTLLTAIVVGVLAGYMLSPSSFIAAQSGGGDSDSGLPKPPTWETTFPAPGLSPRGRTLWPNQPTQATHWSIEDIRAAHEVLAEAELAGRTLDPNTTLHDFPYWTRSHSLFIRHIAEKITDGSAEQHMGYAQFIVVMGGAGTLVVGGELQAPRSLTEQGRSISGELRGSSIVGGEDFELSEGNLASIPPNTPAQFTANTRGGMTFMVMKINAMLYPWDLIR